MNDLDFGNPANPLNPTHPIWDNRSSASLPPWFAGTVCLLVAAFAVTYLVLRLLADRYHRHHGGR